MSGSLSYIPLTLSLSKSHPELVEGKDALIPEPPSFPSFSCLTRESRGALSKKPSQRESRGTHPSGSGHGGPVLSLTGECAPTYKNLLGRGGGLNSNPTKNSIKI